jgi:transposase-like protein
MFTTFKTLPELFAAFPTEQSAVDHFTAIRWANGKFCALCGNADAARIGTLTGTNMHKCYVCRKRFSIRVGTIFQDTKLPLRTWYAAIWMITAHPKGIASTTLATDLGITQKTAWFVLHRLRHASRTRSFNAPLKGEVEIDETYIGGREKNKHADKRIPGSQGGKGKSIVFGMLERGGELRAQTIPNTQQKTLEPLVKSNVAKGEKIYTDELKSYGNLIWQYQHEHVNHRAGEYVRDGSIHTNGIEGVWAQLKRQIIGVHHWVSPKHLNRYVTEMTFRYNRGDMPKGDRVNDLLAQTEGPLPYKVLIA